MADHLELESLPATPCDAGELDLMVEELTDLAELNQDFGCCVSTVGSFLCIGGTWGTFGTIGCECI